MSVCVCQVLLSGLITALGIALHNFPEGVAVFLASIKYVHAHTHTHTHTHGQGAVRTRAWHYLHVLYVPPPEQ